MIPFLGGGLVLFMGIRLILKTEEVAVGGAETMVGITNPAAILTFLFAFSYFGISDVSGRLEGMLLVFGVFIGTYIWWSALSGVTCAIKSKIKTLSFRHSNKLFGGILTIFGTVIFIQSFAN